MLYFIIFLLVMIICFLLACLGAAYEEYEKLKIKYEKYLIYK